MPSRYNIHNNEFLESIWQEAFPVGLEKGRQEYERNRMRLLLCDLPEDKFRSVPMEAKARIEAADLSDLEFWIPRILRGSTIEEIIS